MTPRTTSRIAIVLVNWNGWQDSIECLSSLLASDAMRFADIWWVDNDSSDGSVERVATWCAKHHNVADYAPLDGVRHVGSDPVPFRIWHATGQPAPLLEGVQLNIVRSGGNLGFAGGNNSGIVAAGLDRYSHFWLLNTDTVVRHDALDHLLQRAQLDARIGMVGSTLLHYGKPQLVQAMGGGQLDRRTVRASHIGDSSAAADIPVRAEVLRDIEARTAYVVGASMFVTADFIRNVGLMCDDYFLYFEEIDWAARGAGRFSLAYAPQSVVFHKVGASSAKKMGEFSLNLLYRNRIRFTSRFMPQRLGAVKRDFLFELLRHLLKRRWMPARLATRALLDFGKLVAATPPRDSDPRA
jgi:GT2 family glycosyltransferase